MNKGRRTPPMLEFLRQIPESRRSSPPTGDHAETATVPPVAPSAPAAPPQPRRVPPPTRPAPAPRSEPHQVLRETPAPATRGADPEPAGASESFWSPGRLLRIPFSWVLIAAGGVVALLVLTWVVAYNVGEDAGTARVRPYYEGTPGADQNAGGPISDPRSINDPTLARGHADDPDRATPPRRDLQPARSNDPAGNEAGQPGLTPVPTPGGDQAALPTSWRPGEDPRRADHNYLLICRVPWEQAYRAVDFLTRQGVAAAAVPADSRLDPAQAIENNAPHLVILLEAIPSGRGDLLRSRGQDLIRRVKDLGEGFSNQASGNDDFSTCYWSLYKD